MKKILILTLCIALAASCAEEMQQTEDIQIIAEAVLPGQTKVNLTEGSDAYGDLLINVDWEESGESFSVMTASSTTSSTFSQVDDAAFEGTLKSGWTAPYHAFYPATSAANATSIPYDLSSQSGTLTSGNPYMYASSTSGRRYEFLHLTALIKFTVNMPSGYAGTPAELKVSSDKIVATGNVDITASAPAFSGSGKTITLPAQPAAQSSYTVYVYVNPMTASNTITVKITDAASVYEGNLTTSVNIEAGKVYTASVDVAKTGDAVVERLADPSGLYLEQTGETSVKFSWTDNAEGEASYMIYKAEPENNVLNTASIPANSTEYSSSVTAGKVYNFGIQAIGNVAAANSGRVNFGEYKALSWAELQSYNADIHPVTGENLGNTTGIWRECGAPQDIVFTQTGNTAGTITWTCWSSAETGFNIYVRKASETAWTKSHQRTDLTAAVNATTATITGLTAGETYVFGIQTAGTTMARNSNIIETAAVTMEVIPEVTVAVSNVTSNYAYVAIDYTITGLADSEKNAERGIWISTTSNVPGSTGSDGVKLKGPYADGKTTVKQLIPASRLAVGMSYFMRAYAWDASTGTYVYSDPQTIQLAAQPEDKVNLTWKKQTYSSLPSSVEIYKTTSTLNGRALNAWYAIADPEQVDFRVMYPETVGTTRTVATQAENAGDCYVLINGAIFGNYNIGAIITQGTMTQQWHGEIEGCYWATDDNLYNITRAMIGVDASGKAGAYWVGVPEKNQFYYYTSPMTTVAGQAKYGPATSTYPYPAVSWNPYYAISCGPMLVYNSKIMVNHVTSGSHYLTNYECWDESGVYYGNPDRTALGITADGKIVLFVCDGRITASKGAYLTELAMIMKEIGCVHAMNLDGGGSTGMWVKGSGMINYKDGDSWRAVKSTCGFFAK